MVMASIPTAIWARESTSTEEEAVGSNGGSILAVTGTLMGITFVVVSLRCYIRHVMLKSFSADDIVMLVALIMAIMSMVCFVGMVRNGAGRYQKDIKPEWREGLAYWSYIIGEFLVTGISLVKISIGFFLKRFAQTPAQHRFLWGMIIFCAIFMVYSAITFVIACIPLKAMWIPGLRAAPTSKCQTGQVLSIIGTANGVINVLTDVIFCLLPVPVVLALNINRRTRTTLFLILSLGLLRPLLIVDLSACAASVTRMIFGRQRLVDPYYTRHYNFLVWFYIELQVGILAASLPTLRPMFSKLLKGASTAARPGGNYNYGSSRYGYGPRSKTVQGASGRISGGPRRSGFYRQDDLSTPMDTVFMPRRYNGNDRGDNYNGYCMAQIASITHTRNPADDDSEDAILPPGGIHVSKRTEIMWDEDKDSIATAR
ncbi:oxidoreductase [Apiospora phragmitis]|uniref:Oxidoreductase n=1 Tax=Apiospora phragmitis TaxID=2905665 RepID=A0ABR1UV31_9PEZI